MYFDMIHMYTSINWKGYDVDACLVAPDNAISGNETSSEMLTSQSKKKRNEPKQLVGCV